MLRRVTLFCALFMGLGGLMLLMGLILIRPADIKAMQTALNEKNHTTSQAVFSTTQQRRKGVVKEIWLTQEDKTRLQYRIESERSLLTVQPEGKKFDLIEKLEKIRCWMQDKVYYASTETNPMQQMRFFRAQEGTYRYTSQEFLAQTVALSLYRLTGHALPIDAIKTTPFLQGIAEDVSFSVSGKNPQFNAQHFKAQLNRSPEENK